jgi:hypothetical protein
MNLPRVRAPLTTAWTRRLLSGIQHGLGSNPPALWLRRPPRSVLGVIDLIVPAYSLTGYNTLPF